MNLLEYKLSSLLNILHKEQAYDIIKRSNHISKIIEKNRTPLTYPEYLEYLQKDMNININNPLELISAIPKISEKNKNKNQFFNSDELKKIEFRIVKCG